MNIRNFFVLEKEGKDRYSVPDSFIPDLRECCDTGLSEPQLAKKDHIPPSFKVKIVKNDQILKDRTNERKKLININLII